MTSDTKQNFNEKRNVYKIRDLSLHSFGRKEINLAHTEMPGLMSLREEYSARKPFKNARIAGSLHMTIQTAVLIETLQQLGADVRWSSCNIFSTQDHAAAAIVQAGSAAVFAWKGETIPEYWDCLYQTLVWPDGKGPDLIVDDGGDATLLLHEGVKAEKKYEATGKLPEVEENAHPEKQAMVEVLRRSIREDGNRWQKIAEDLKGVSEETTTGVARLNQLDKSGELLIPAFNVNDSVTKSKFDNIYGCKHSLPDGIKRATDTLISGKKVVVCGFGDVGKGCAAAMKAEGARVTITEIDPICALQALMEGYNVDTLTNVCKDTDIIITATGNKNVVNAAHLRNLPNNAIVCNIGHFDNEIDVQSLIDDESVVRTEIKAQVDRFEFPDGNGVIILAEGRLVNLACATGHPSMVMSASFTNQVLAVLSLWTGNEKYSKKVYRLPKKLDEKVARLHLGRFGAKLTKLTNEQAEYVGLNLDGPFKSEEYRY